MKNLTFYERLILEYINFRTNNNIPFFETNETIARCIDITKGSAKVLINNLIRKGYLCKSTDGKHKRVLKLSGMEFPRMPWINMSNVRAYGLKKERDELKAEYERASKNQMEYQNSYFAERNKNDALRDDYRKLENEYMDFQKEAVDAISTLKKERDDKTKLIENIDKKLKLQGLNEEQIKDFWKAVNTFD